MVAGCWSLVACQFVCWSLVALVVTLVVASVVRVAGAGCLLVGCLLSIIEGSGHRVNDNTTYILLGRGMGGNVEDS